MFFSAIRDTDTVRALVAVGNDGMSARRTARAAILETKIICTMCGGDGHETCNNPDHRFIYMTGGEIGRLGCPCCGHDENHKIPGGEKGCELCAGTGMATVKVQREYMGEDLDAALDWHGTEAEIALVNVLKIIGG